ncbi:DUF4179 domain-containing protein [Flavonifractor sp. HCP28S3_F3]|uniref:DUF4179 domain-containing protein n=1 Tax=Flavonifractor sp. HCP28S3_F3 TaxID=3438939 RepID=UPI003F8A970C
MNRYQDTMDRLRFTPEQKEDMVDRLMASEVATPRRVLPIRRLAAAGVAAALVLSLGAAGATGALGEVGAAFSAIFGSSAQTEVIDKIGYPVGASDTDHGITVTADAIVGDTYSYAVVYTIQREDGTALVSDDVLARAANPETEALPLAFQSHDTTPRGYKGGSHARTWFFDADPADNAIQFVELRTQDTPIQPGELTVQLRDLELYNEDYTACTTLAEGSWTLKFQLDFEDSSRVLPCGQTFRLDGAEAELNTITLSPLSIQVDYTVHGAGDPSLDWIEPLSLSLTYTDGTTLDLSHAGGSSAYGEDGVNCQKSMIFDQILSLDEVASITVGDVVIPVTQ